MKYELLKRTAIALFVGSVISTYSVAENGKISENSSPREVANAINENSDRITAVEEDLTTKADQAYVDSLQNVTRSHTKDIKALSEGIRDNVLPAIEANRSDIDANTAAIGKLKDLALKADKDAVAENRKNIDKNTSRITGIYNKQGLQNIRLNNHSDRITAVEEDLMTKADQAYVDSLQNVTRSHTKDIKALSEGIRDNVLPAIEANRSDIDANTAAIGKLKDLAKSLQGDSKNPGLLGALEEANKGLNENKEALALKADKDAVAKNRKDIDKNTSRITGTYNKQLLQDIRLNNHSDRITAVEEELTTKADEAYVDSLQNVTRNHTKNIKALSEGIRDNVLPAIEANRSDIDKNTSRITDTRNKQVLQNARLDNHGERIEANEAAIGDLARATDEAVKNLGNAVTGLDADLAGTQDAVAENRKDIDANTVAIDKLKETQTYKDLSKVENLVKDKADKTAVEKNALRITDTRNKQVLQNARLDNHGERIDANKAAIGDLARATNEAVTNLGNAVSSLDEDLAGTQDAVAENRKDIDKNASRITDTRNKQVLQNTRLDNHGQRIDANKAAIATNVADIATNKADIATNKADIANKADKNSVYSKSETDNKFALKADNSVVSAQAADINNLRTDVNAHKVDIDKLRTDVNTHTKRLDHLDNRVNKLDKDLKRGLASQAALTGLFQPYTVGKANFTAAVGGYKSQTAVAVGTGYRYNQNIATKAGVAFTQGGGVTYNAGVNFEW